MKKTLFILWFLPLLVYATEPPLSELVKDNTRPWLNHEANSEQRHPYYMGASPREMEFDAKVLITPVLPEKMKKFGEAQLLKIGKRLGKSHFQVEAWPFLNDDGDPAWVFSRVRNLRSSSWTWLKEGDWVGNGSFAAPAPALPVVLRPWVTSERKALFQDFLELESLYDKPVFGDSVWTSVDGKKVLGGWFPLSTLQEKEKFFTASKDYVARVLPQPARFNDKPMSFIIEVKGKQVTWPLEIEWKKAEEVSVSTGKLEHPLSFPENYPQEYKRWVETLAGSSAKFKKKNSADPENELEGLADQLESYYVSLGLKTKRQTFMYRGVKQSNLMAILPGTLKGKANLPILFGDHYDTAFEEDTFEATGKRVATSGANDNVTATASLLMAAKVLKDQKEKPKHDIWFIHFTGEEYPSDDLGARKFLGQLLKDKQAIQGLVLIDMIGYRKTGDKIFQINLGAKEGNRLGSIGLAAAFQHAPMLSPQVRGRYDELSYLYNTDGYIFSNLGFPVVYFNEHLNRKNLGETNPHYHQSTDIPENVDYTYAIPISEAAIATLWELAN